MHVKPATLPSSARHASTPDGGGDDGMSLFQDLKLKRRKVDSRCSSDGESVGTSDSTPSLSPDTPTHGSPNQKERCCTPEEMVCNGGGTNHKKAPPPPFPPGFMYILKSAENGVIKHINGAVGPVVVKAEPRERDSAHTPPVINGHAHNNNHAPRINGSAASPNHASNNQDHEPPTPLKREVSASPVGSSEVNGHREAGPVSSSSSSPLPPLVPHPPVGSPHQNSGGSTPSPPRGGPSPSTLIITRKEPPPGTNGTRIHSPPHQTHPHPMLAPQNHLHARLTGQSIGGGQRSSPLHHPMSNGHQESKDPFPVVTSTSLSFHHQSMYRINGVRPEVISGGAVTPTTTNGNTLPPPPLTPTYSRKSPTHSNHTRSPNSSPLSNCSGGSCGPLNGGTIVAGGSLGSAGPGGGAGGHHHHVNLNRTPTVIMGEAGGVRTMLWSAPGQNLPSELGLSPPHHAQRENHFGHTHSLSSSSASSSPPHAHPTPPTPGLPPPSKNGGLSMERLWASEALNLSTGGGAGGRSNGVVLANRDGGNGFRVPGLDEDDYEQPMICMICEDRATGLHYGIITCEGCKGFFKRTVQNRRVYTCVADGGCEITKAQRNRCQYCRFKKCIEQGMVLQAVREDRMPGGRNSGAVYNLYKVPVKYRKHKKGSRASGGIGGKGEKGVGGVGVVNGHGLQSPQCSPMSGTILKAALTNPHDVSHLRPTPPFEQAAAMITHLVQCDNFQDIAALQNWEELLEGRGDLSDKLCQMGDSIVYRLVQWTKRLPFYGEVPVEVHTRVLTHKWHELLVLTTSAWQAMHTPLPPVPLSPEEETLENLQVLQRCLQAMMGRSLTLDQLRQDVGQMVERLTYLTRSFRRIGIRIEEYVSLKVIAMLQDTGCKSAEVSVIRERYVKCLRTFLDVTCPNHPNRLADLLRTLPEVQAAASLLLESKMFYVPFLLNSALIQR